MKQLGMLTLFSILALFLIIQFVPVDQHNPPVEAEVPASPEVRSVLRRACYDCHSNETRWPWYSRIAPASWLIAHDVNEGREVLNFSTWNRLATKKRIHALHESWEEVEEGEMPPWFYLLPHPDARLSEGDRAALRDWSHSAVAQLKQQSAEH